MPLGPDLFLIAKGLACNCFPLRAVLLVIVAYIFSSSVNFWLGRKAAHVVKIKKKHEDKIRKIIEKYSFWGVFFVAIGPIPVREGAIVAGLMDIKFSEFITAMTLGVTIRFTAEGLLAPLFITHQFGAGGRIL